MQPKTTPFDQHLNAYEQWFEENRFAYLSEIETIRKVWPTEGTTIEIGIGSGLFALPLSISQGIEPSSAMRKKAKERGLNVIEAVAEVLPYPDESIDAALMVTTICFVNDPLKAFQESYRVLRDTGNLVIAFVDRESPVGQMYLQHKDESLFYKEATFFSSQEIITLLSEAGFRVAATYQTIFGHLEQLQTTETPKTGYGKGSFVVISAKKRNDKIRVAFAVNEDMQLPDSHFGDASYFDIYQWENNTLKHIETIPNKQQKDNVSHRHGDADKGEAIVDLLQQHHVNIVVSKQFGKNILSVKKHFLPVLVDSSNLEESKNNVALHITPILEHLNNNMEEHNSLSLRNR
jgi:ubiquinone/menaquinone biosynthesis C-methylase UbiE/predicted Fe-Mo cluster-binding NifX family protein